MIRTITTTVVAGLLLTSVLACGQSAAAKSSSSSSAGRDAEAVQDFQQRVKQYLDARKQLAGKSPRPTNSTAKLEESRRQMAQGVQAARPDARPGAIFTPAITDYFRRQIAATLAGPEGSSIRTSLRHAEPVKGFVPKVNQQYPRGVPLQSTPAGLLLNLPQLPKELQYRIVGDYLVLLDTAPNTIVDFIPHVLPQS